ncbi:hypothetical protein QBC41DRAFT_16545 [Cercophora samala]|uniref:Uncharacterized protein n=1 Tax=Cercophora samala TaxID=330535 RepID=A0AA39Z6Q5_9PEZI|nr:hypothetical protein QBC41DRAFT_16545 [Cercophora samala]
MCQGTKSRMSCGHFHLNFHERCDAWCSEPQVQIIMHKDEQCGHCIAKTEVDSSRANYGKYYNKEKHQLSNAWAAYCKDKDGKREMLVSLRERIIRSNRAIRALREECPDLDHLESVLEVIKKEKAETEWMIWTQMSRVEAEGGMEELLKIKEKRSSLMRKTEFNMTEKEDTLKQLLDRQVLLMERCPELTKLECMKRRLGQLECYERNLCSHGNLAKLDALIKERAVYEAEQTRITDETLSDLKSIESRLRHQAMEEKANVKKARRNGRAAAYKEPESDPAPEIQVAFHDSLYQRLKTGRLGEGPAQDSHVMTSETLPSRPSAASESDLPASISLKTDIFGPGNHNHRGRTQSAYMISDDHSRNASGQSNPSPRYPSPQRPAFRSRRPGVDQNWCHVRSIDESSDAETATVGSQTPTNPSLPFPTQYSTVSSSSSAGLRSPDTVSSSNHGAADEALANRDHSELGILLNLINYDSVSPTAMTFSRRSPSSDAPQSFTFSPTSTLSSGLDDTPQCMMSGAMNTSNSLRGNSFPAAIYEDPLLEQEQDEAQVQPRKPTTPGRQTSWPQQDQASWSSVSGTISSHSTVPPIAIPRTSDLPVCGYGENLAYSSSRRSLKATERMSE